VPENRAPVVLRRGDDRSQGRRGNFEILEFADCRRNHLLERIGVDFGEVVVDAFDFETKAGGEIVSVDNWGKKKLAYRIKKEDFAVYVYFDIKLPADAPIKISGIFNITDEILRYLLVKVDEKNRKILEEAKLKNASPEKDNAQEEE